MVTTIPAFEAKAKFSELLERVLRGSFSITFQGEETVNRASLEGIQRTIADIKGALILSTL